VKSHVWRPLYLALGAIALLLVARKLMVPADFGVHGASFTYNFYRLASIDDWKNMPVHYRGKDTCTDCHEDKVKAINASPHAQIQCENCHGPAGDHPDNPALLEIDRSRALCLRCHTGLPYPSSHRADLPGVDPENHNPRTECAECHNPHNPDLEAM